MESISSLRFFISEVGSIIISEEKGKKRPSRTREGGGVARGFEKEGKKERGKL